MNPGDLKHAILIQTKTETPDGLGGMTTSWGTFAQVRAAVWPVSAKEIISNGQLQAQRIFRVRIRYLAGVTSAMRILFAGRILNIQSIVNPEELCEKLDLICLEEV